MASKVMVQRNIFAESLAIVGRAVASHAHLPILSNVLISKDEGQLRLSATDLTLGVTVWMDANMDGEVSSDPASQDSNGYGELVYRAGSDLLCQWQTGSFPEMWRL